MQLSHSPIAIRYSLSARCFVSSIFFFCFSSAQYCQLHIVWNFQFCIQHVCTHLKYGNHKYNNSQRSSLKIPQTECQTTNKNWAYVRASSDSTNASKYLQSETRCYKINTTPHRHAKWISRAFRSFRFTLDHQNEEREEMKKGKSFAYSTAYRTLLHVQPADTVLEVRTYAYGYVDGHSTSHI